MTNCVFFCASVYFRVSTSARCVPWNITFCAPPSSRPKNFQNQKLAQSALISAITATRRYSEYLYSSKHSTRFSFAVAKPPRVNSALVFIKFYLAPIYKPATIPDVRPNIYSSKISRNSGESRAVLHRSDFGGSTFQSSLAFLG